MRARGRILIVDDEADLRLGLAETLQGEGYQVDTAGEGWTALEQVRATAFDLALVDLKMPGPDGLMVLDAIKQLSPETLVVVITGYASVESAVEAMKLGAYDYLAKPFKLEQVRLVVGRAVGQKRLSDENRRLRQAVARSQPFAQIVGRSLPMQEMFRAIEQAAPTPSTVLIYGETGTGKDLVARALHQRSPRAQGPFVAISCGALPEALLESELFGHVKGAFTGAHADRQGVFEAAEGGSLFLDEVGDIPLSMQVKLLRVLQEREIQRLGESRSRKVDVRLVAATHKDLKEEMRQGRFREDLYYRLEVVSVVVPPLRQRREDIPLLVDFFLDKYGREVGKGVGGVSPAALVVLMGYEWPGNVRELQNAIERGVILAEGAVLEPEDLPLGRPGGPGRVVLGAEGGMSLAEVERGHILRVLQETGFHQSRAARILGIGRRTLYRKIRQYRLDLPE